MRVTHHIDISTPSLVSRIPTPVGDPRKGTRNILVNPVRLLEIQLVAVPVTIRAAGVAFLGTPRDGHRAATGPLEGDGTGNGLLAHVGKGCAGRLVSVGASARGCPFDPGGGEFCRCLGVFEFSGFGK